MTSNFKPVWTAMLVPRLLSVAALLAIGCAPTTAPEVEKEVSSAGKTQKVAQPVKVAGGSIRGQVVDNSGAGIGGAEVRVSESKSISANPIPPAAVKELDNGRIMSLMHDFGDGKGEVLVERRPRLTQTAIERYVYLRPGEFFVERIPPGKATLTGTFLSATAKPVTVTVVKDKTTSDVKLVLPLGGAPAPSSSPSASPVTGDATFVEWSGLKPETGLSVRVQSTGLVYTPTSPTMKVGLKASAGGVRVTGYTLVYQWTEGGSPKQSTPERVPMLPVSLTAGTTVEIDVVLGGAVLADIYKEKTDPKTGQTTSVLSTVTADVKFTGEDGLPLTGKDGKDLSVGIPIRRL